MTDLSKARTIHYAAEKLGLSVIRVRKLAREAQDNLLAATDLAAADFVQARRLALEAKAKDAVKPEPRKPRSYG